MENNITVIFRQDMKERAASLKIALLFKFQWSFLLREFASWKISIDNLFSYYKVT